MCQANSRFHYYEPLLSLGLKKIAPINSTLGWQIEVNALNKTKSLPYYLTVAFVGSTSGLSLLALNKQGDLQLALHTANSWTFHQSLNDTIESGVLVFMTNNNAFNTDKIQSQFSEKFNSAPYNIIHAQNFLKQYAQNSQIYFFDTAKQPSPCKSDYVS